MPAYLAFKSVVDPSDCDFLGHMNVSRYFAACSDSVFAMQAEMGLTADDMRSGRRFSFAVVNINSDFRQELGSGEAIQMESEILEIGKKSMTFRHTLRKVADGETAFTAVFKCVLLNLETRRAEVLPGDVSEKAKLWMDVE
ncbi:acyl-CoA thioesterase [Ruegeria arenilitoris]|uniref:acyl-CoA thioesterase n=1 Tax=Ruegeria arenilitoris TaxID=1173585 RepID=UPI00148041C0|nr:acyl-CoA thioesterase [Ruegeria arenilitoris]